MNDGGDCRTAPATPGLLSKCTALKSSNGMGNVACQNSTNMEISFLTKLKISSSTRQKSTQIVGVGLA